MKVRKIVFCASIVSLLLVVFACDGWFSSSKGDKNSSGKSDTRTLVDPEYSYTDDFEDERDEEFWYKSANNKFPAADITDSSNRVVESLYGSEQALQSGGDSWSELGARLPVKAVQIEFGFREYTPESYNISTVRNHKTVGAHSGTYGIVNSNISIKSECWPKDGGGSPSIYTGYDGKNRGHFMTPGDPLLWEEGDGKWHDVHVFYQLAKRPGEYGFMELYRDGKLLVSNRVDEELTQGGVSVEKLIGFATRGNFLDHIRLYGWANGESGFEAYDEPTHFLRDDFYLHANTVHGETTGGRDLSVIKEESTVLYDYNFSDSSAPEQGDGLSYGSANGGSMDFSNGYLSAYYPAKDGNTNWWSMSVLDQKTSEIFVEFDARMPDTKYGFKFLKIFGQVDEDGGYSNVTLGLDYTGIDNGALLCVSFGDGSENQNDTANLIWLDGSKPSAIGRSYQKTAHVVTPQKKAFASSDWKSEWHHFKFYWKFDTAASPEEEINDNADGKANGACYLEIDGKTYVIASGLLNRHYSNSLNVESVSLTNWTQGADAGFTIDYDNIKVSTGGFVNE